MKVAICGSAVSSAHLAPVSDQEWEIWACSPASVGQLKRIDRWFELHVWDEYIQSIPGYVEFLRDFKGPVYTGGPVDLPTSKLYPIEEVEREFTSYFLTSSISLMIALAILEKVDVIGLYGVDMSEREEYTKQRSGCHFFVLEALRRKIGIYVPKESCLLRPQPVYGLCEWYDDYQHSRLRSANLNRAIETYNKTLEEAEMKVAQYSAVAQNIDFNINIWSSPYGLASGKVIWSKDED